MGSILVQGGRGKGKYPCVRREGERKVSLCKEGGGGKYHCGRREGEREVSL